MKTKTETKTRTGTEDAQPIASVLDSVINETRSAPIPDHVVENERTRQAMYQFIDSCEMKSDEGWVRVKGSRDQLESLTGFDYDATSVSDTIFSDGTSPKGHDQSLADWRSNARKALDRVIDSANRNGRRLCLICPICFKIDCYLTHWVDE